MNQDDRMGDYARDLGGDSMQIDRGPRVCLHHIDQDLHGDVGWKLGPPRRKPANTWMRNPVTIEDAENLVSVEIEEVEWSEVSGHNVMVPHQSTHAHVLCQRGLGVFARDNQAFGLRLAD